MSKERKSEHNESDIINRFLFPK